MNQGLIYFKSCFFVLNINDTNTFTNFMLQICLIRVKNRAISVQTRKSPEGTT